eukprot:m51a1_g1606 putative protein serine threonine kinase (882) ;mRNA; r:188027-191761
MSAKAGQQPADRECCVLNLDSITLGMSSAESSPLCTPSDPCPVVRTPFGSFTMMERVGKGAFASVYKAFWNETHVYVAIKRFDATEMGPDEIDRVMEEVALMKRLKHPNILRIFDCHKDDQFLNIVLELAEGGSLLKFVTKVLDVVTEEVVCVYAEQIARALEYLHASNIIHRDLKAGNVLLMKDGAAKLADFGVAAVVEGMFKRTTVLGSPYWMAPEVIEGRPYSFPSDIWSFACTIIELLTGEPPNFGLSPMAAMFRTVQSTIEIPKTFSPELTQLLTACFSKDADQRPTARELLQHRWFYKFKSSPLYRELSVTRDSEGVRRIVDVIKKDRPEECKALKEEKIRRAASHVRPIPRSGSVELSSDDDRDAARRASAHRPKDTRAPSTSRSPSLDRSRPATSSTQSVMLSPRSLAKLRTSHDPSISFSSVRKSLTALEQTKPVPVHVAEIHRHSKTETVVTATGLRHKHGDSLTSPPPPILGPPLEISVKDRRKSFESVKEPIRSPEPTERRSYGKTSCADPQEISALPEVKRFSSLRCHRRSGSSSSNHSADGSGSAKTESRQERQEATSLRTIKSGFLTDLVPRSVDVPDKLAVWSLLRHGKNVYAGTGSGYVLVHKAVTGELVSRLRLHTGRIYSIASVSSKVWCSSEEGDIYVLNPRHPAFEWKKVLVHDSDHKMIRCLLVLDIANHLRVWSCATSQTDCHIVVLNKQGKVKSRMIVDHAVTCACQSPAADFVWVGGIGVVTVISVAASQPIRQITLPRAKKVVQMLPAGEFAWAVCGRSIYVVDTAGAVVATISLSSEADGAMLMQNVCLVGCEDGTVECYDAVSRASVCRLAKLECRVMAARSFAAYLESETESTVWASSPESSAYCLWHLRKR